jgi:exopolysaccharide biosynthesis polyprenyl glycosylphosphotransferase
LVGGKRQPVSTHASTQSTPVTALASAVDETLAPGLPSQGVAVGAASRPARTLFGDARWLEGCGRALVVWFSVLVFFLDRPLAPGSTLLVVTLLASVWILAIRSAFAAGHYTLGPAVPTAVGTATGLVFAAAVDHVLSGIAVPTLELLAMATTIFTLATAWAWAVQRTRAARRRVLVVGSSRFSAAVAHEVGDAAPFEIVGTVDDEGGTAAGSVPVLGPMADLADVVEAQRPDFVVLTDEQGCAQAIERLLDVAGTGFKVVSMSHFIEYAFGRVPLRHLTSTWFMSVLHLRQGAYARWSKRTFDLLVAGGALLFTAPLFVLVGLLVRSTPGPIVYRQRRLGEGGRPFTIFKFRTMVADAEPDGEAVWADAFDPRITPVGRFLRRTHLDELPQLLNVLRGDMSIVGPRPERPEFVRNIEEAVPFWNRRLLIKPGVTGWAQVRCGYAADCESTAEKLAYDLWYLRHRNLVIDLAVCVQTARMLLSDSRAH